VFGEVAVEFRADEADFGVGAQMDGARGGGGAEGADRGEEGGAGEEGAAAEGASG